MKPDSTHHKMLGLAHEMRPSFGGHETFPFRYAWPKKAHDAVVRDPTVFTREDALVTLGVGKNMVKSMRHWALALGILQVPTSSERRTGHLEVTSFGHSLLAEDGWDPYLEDPGTLWLMHWRIASTPEYAPAWYFLFNEVAEPRFSRAGLIDRIMIIAKQKAWTKVSPASLKRDVDTLVRSYADVSVGRPRAIEDQLDCPLTELSLVEESTEAGMYELKRGSQPTLPTEIFLYAVIEYARRLTGGQKTIAMEQLHFSPGSPGRTFLLDAEGLFSRAESLGELTDGDIVFDSTAGLSQLLIKQLPNAEHVLRRYYRGLAA